MDEPEHVAIEKKSKMYFSTRALANHSNKDTNNNGLKGHAFFKNSDKLVTELEKNNLRLGK